MTRLSELSEDQGGMEPFPENVVRPGVSKESLAADGGKNGDAQKHG